MQDGVLDSDGDGQGISRVTDKDDEHWSSRGGLQNPKKGKGGLTIPNNPGCLSWPLGAEC